MHFHLSMWLAALGAIAVVEADHHPVTGARVSRDGPVPRRVNINEMQSKGGPRWDLFLLSLKEMHEMKASDELSFFQIAGIHGKPYIEWNDAGARRTDGWGGYCPHGEKLFLPWHRPYLALYEQEVVKHARRIAAKFPKDRRDEYMSAADELRVPFWDWASEQAVPPATVPPKVRVNAPSGESMRTVEIDNPLASYRFPRSVLDGRYGSWDSQNRKQIRHCVGSSYTYPSSANSNLRARPYKQWTYDVLTRSGSFDEFASPDGGGVGLEQIHNAVHWDGSCGGQFLALDFTAFDPLFMLHHANADRLWAYWSAMNPRSTVFTKAYKGLARFATPSGTTITPETPLVPFYQPSGEFHTSLTAADIRNFGYTYEGLEYWHKSEREMRKDTIRLVNRLYSPNGGSAAGMFSSKKPETRYFVQLELDMAEVPRPCQIQVLVADKFAGSVVVMDKPGKGIMRGGFTIDSAVREAGYNKLGQDELVAKIKKNLQVKIVKGDDGSEVAVKSVSSFKWQLETLTYTPGAGSEGLPKFSNTKTHNL